MFRTYRFRAYPTEEQEETLLRWQHAQRALWNAAHEQRLERLRRPDGSGKRWLKYEDQAKELTEARGELEWLREVPGDFQQPLLAALHRAWDSFLSRKSGLPHFKSKAKEDWVQLRTLDPKKFRIRRSRVRLTRIGWIRIRSHLRIEGQPRCVSITRDVDQWFISITCAYDVLDPIHPNKDSVVGIDLGVTNVIADSDGNLVTNPRHFNRSRKLLTRRQRQLARKQKGSNRRKKAKTLVAKAHRKIRRQRQDFLHNLSCHYSNSHGLVVVEKLEIKNMTRSARGTVESPGTNVRAKSGLNRSILDVGWYEFKRQLGYKLEWKGGVLVEVDPKYTSQTCSVCGHVDAKSREKQTFFCTSCCYLCHADVNAAKNILARGLSSGHTTGTAPVAARGGSVTRRPEKREFTQAIG